IEHMLQVIDHERVRRAVDSLPVDRPLAQPVAESLLRRPPTPKAATIKPPRTKSALVTRLQSVQSAPEAMPSPRARRKLPDWRERLAHRRPAMTVVRIALAGGGTAALGKPTRGLSRRRA